MFDSLDEQIRHDMQSESSMKERVMRYILIGAVSVVTVSGIFAAVHFVN